MIWQDDKERYLHRRAQHAVSCATHEQDYGQDSMPSPHACSSPAHAPVQLMQSMLPIFARNG